MYKIPKSSHFFKFFILLLCFFQNLFAEQQGNLKKAPKFLNFSSLELISHHQMVIKNGELIQIKGFLYANDLGEVVLAEEPNLKSCCIGSALKRKKQLKISGKLSFKEYKTAVAILLQGQFYFKPGLDFPYTLENAEIIDKPTTLTTLYFIVAVLIFIILIFILFKAIKSRKKQNSIF